MLFTSTVQINAVFSDKGHLAKHKFNSLYYVDHSEAIVALAMDTAIVTGLVYYDQSLSSCYSYESCNTSVIKKVRY